MWCIGADVADLELKAETERESRISLRRRRRNGSVAAEHATDPRAAWEIAQIEQAKQDPAAFEPLYERYADSMWRFALSRLGEQEWAADAVSQTFTKAIAALSSFEPKTTYGTTGFESWLMTIARNVIVDDVRRQRPSAPLDSPAAQPWIVDQRRLPEEAAIAADERLRVNRALAQLSETQRQIVELCVAGAKGIEIAETLGMSVSAVRTAHHRAYARLRELLAEPGEDQGTPK